MVKKYAELTEKRWRDKIEFMVTDHKFTFSSSCGWCYSTRRLLIHSGDWENFPADLKHTVGFHALVYEREMYPNLRENQIMRIEEKIRQLETEKQGYITELSILKNKEAKA